MQGSPEDTATSSWVSKGVGRPSGLSSLLGRAGSQALARPLGNEEQGLGDLHAQRCELRQLPPGSAGDAFVQHFVSAVELCELRVKAAVPAMASVAAL